MKKLVLFLSIALLSSVLFNACKPSDEKLQKSVETALSTINSDLKSTVKDGIVTLNGTVDSEEAKIAAEQVVKAVKSIKSVSNNIQVALPTPAVTINPDNILTTTINAALSAAGFSGLNVAVNNGEVTLTGDAKKSDLAKIMQVANEAKPAKVINQLKLK